MQGGEDHGGASAVWFPRARHVELRNEQLPPLGQTDLLISTVASGISQGTEMLVYRGQVPADTQLDLPTLRGRFGFPIKYGYSAVGRVERVGSAVTDLRPGNLVFVHHPHQTRFVVDHSLPVRLPNRSDPYAGVFLANLETALNVMLDAAPRIGETVAIFGQGVVGLLLTQLARRVGAGLVLVIEPSSLRRQAALDCGADHALDPGDAAERTRALTAGRGVDLALEVSGQPAALDEAIASTAREGTVVVASWYGTKPVSLDLGSAFHRRRLKIVSSQVGSINPALQPRWTRERRLAVAVNLLPELRLIPLITNRVPFREAAAAYAVLDSGPEEILQVILSYGEGDV